MVLKKKARFTPELLISAPRRTPAIPNYNGTHALFTVSTYSIEANTETKEVKVLDIVGEDNPIHLFSDDQTIKEPQWLVGTHILWKKSIDGGKSELWAGNAVAEEKNQYLIGTINGPISNIKTKLLHDGSIALAFTAPATHDGQLLNPETLPKPVSTAREYESVRIRFWNTYWKPHRSTLWYTTLIRDKITSNYKLSKGPCHNALQDTAIEFPWCEDPMSGGSYEIASSGLLVNVINPKYDPAERLTSEVFYIALKTFQESTTTILPLTHVLKGWTGSATGGTFSPNGKKIALLKRKDWRHDWAHSSIFVLDLEKRHPKTTVPTFELSQVQFTLGYYWDRSPHSLIWSEDNSELYAVAEDRGRNRLFRICLNADDEKLHSSANLIPIMSGSITSVYRLRSEGKQPGSAFFVNATSFIDSCIYQKIVPDGSSNCVLSSATQAGAAFGLRASQVSEFTFPGTFDDYECQSFIIKPSFFDRRKKYPVALWPHGGPTMAWTDSWTYRWNAVLLAEQGYIVIMPNVTGSTGFGQELCKAVFGEWGGRPFQDLRKCWEYVEGHFDYADTSRAVCMGASYGGYMVNWIAGFPFAKKFRTLVCHDGIFDNLNLISSDVAATTSADMGGQIFDPKALSNWEKYSPSRYTANWTQPMLIIHSDNDYRCPITEGLAAFNVCQMKGIESRFLNFPDECHFVQERANSLHWHKTVFGWVNKFVGITDGVRLEAPVSEPWKKSDVNEKVKKMEDMMDFLTEQLRGS